MSYYGWGVPEEWAILCGEADRKARERREKHAPNVVPGTVPCTINFGKIERERQLPKGLSRKILNPRVNTGRHIS